MESITYGYSFDLDHLGLAGARKGSVCVRCSLDATVGRGLD